MPYSLGTLLVYVKYTNIGTLQNTYIANMLMLTMKQWLYPGNSEGANISLVGSQTSGISSLVFVISCSATDSFSFSVNKSSVKIGGTI